MLAKLAKDYWKDLVAFMSPSGYTVTIPTDGSSESHGLEQRYRDLLKARAPLASYPISIVDYFKAKDYLSKNPAPIVTYDHLTVDFMKNDPSAIDQTVKDFWSMKFLIPLNDPRFMERVARIWHFLDYATVYRSIPISYPVNLDQGYTPEEIKAKQNYIMNRSGLDRRNFVVSVDNTKLLYQLVNEEFFRGQLPDAEKIHFDYSNRLTKTAGHVRPLIGKYNQGKQQAYPGKSYVLTMSGDIFNPGFDPGKLHPEAQAKCGASRLECYLETLEHEMVHVALYHFGQYQLKRGKRDPIYSSHGSLFKAVHKAYFNKDEIYHSYLKTIEQSEQRRQMTDLPYEKYQSYEIRAGLPVLFVAQDKIFTGRVKRKRKKYAELEAKMPDGSYVFIKIMIDLNHLYNPYKPIAGAPTAVLSMATVDDIKAIQVNDFDIPYQKYQRNELRNGLPAIFVVKGEMYTGRIKRLRQRWTEMEILQSDGTYRISDYMVDKDKLYNPQRPI